MKRAAAPYVAYCMIVGLIGLGACLDIGNSTVGPTQTVAVVVQPPTPAPTVSPTATPSPGTASGSNDVASLGIFDYAKCVEGQPFVITPGCSGILVTATPKRADNSDALNGGRALTWRVNGIPVPDTTPGLVVNCVLVSTYDPERTFNRRFQRVSAAACSVLIEAQLVTPDGGIYPASKTLTVQ